jgi:DnaJ-class molecular chaperone
MATEAWQQFDCYKILGVHVAAAPIEVRKAYHRASREAHPDHGGSHEGQVRVNLAYEVLSDPVTRQAHDLFWYRFRAPAVGGPGAPASPRSSGASPGQPAVAEPFEALLGRVREALGRLRGPRPARRRLRGGMPPPRRRVRGGIMKVEAAG